MSYNRESNRNCHGCRGGFRICQKGRTMESAKQSPQRGPRAEHRWGPHEAGSHFHTTEGPEVKDLSDSLPQCPRQTASHSRDQPLLSVNGAAAQSAYTGIRPRLHQNQLITDAHDVSRLRMSLCPFPLSILPLSAINLSFVDDFSVIGCYFNYLCRLFVKKRQRRRPTHIQNCICHSFWVASMAGLEKRRFLRKFFLRF